MRLQWALVLACVAGCAASAADGQPSNGDAGASDGNSCGTIITFEPDEPQASNLAPVRAVVNVVGAPGVFTYDWSVTRSGSAISYTSQASDNSKIDFIAAVAGPYRVTVAISGPVPNGCGYAEGTVNVLQPGAKTTVYRLRAVPPGGSVPPQETVIQVNGGADYARDIALDPGLDLDLAVQQTGTGAGVPAYVKLMPIGAPNAFTEVFTGSTGAFATHLLGQMHQALVIPESSSIAPALVTWAPGSTALTIGPGSVVSGIVKGPSGTALAGAKVQLTSGGVPSTVATTAGDGTFSLRESYGSGAQVIVRVTPPAGSGLPKLESTGAFNLGTSLQITYAATLATCDLANVVVKRTNVAQAGANVTVVGTLAGTAGTVSAGVSLAATGTVHVAATADGAGKLPSTLVPRGALSAVVKIGGSSTDYAVSALDTSTCSVTVVDAPPAITRTGTAQDSTTTALKGVRVEATPIGALAAADAQTVSATTNASGAFSIALASGGRYDVRFVDPYARAARLEQTNIAPASVVTIATLPKAIVISGKLTVAGSTQPVAGASVQILCATCTGISATRPVAETASDGLSSYRIAVPDPGTM